MNWFKRHKKIAILLCLAVLYLGWSRYDRRFTPQRWAETDISHRGKLVNSLLEQYDGLVGMTREEVEELLGADSDGMWIEERLNSDGGSEKIPLLIYAAGGRPGTIFPEYLYVYLADDRVIEVKIVAD